MAKGTGAGAAAGDGMRVSVWVWQIRHLVWNPEIEQNEDEEDEDGGPEGAEGGWLPAPEVYGDAEVSVG